MATSEFFKDIVATTKLEKRRVKEQNFAFIREEIKKEASYAHSSLLCQIYFDNIEKFATQGFKVEWEEKKHAVELDALLPCKISWEEE